MIITCQECNTSFNLDESLLKQTGSKVRCSKCKNIFLAFPPTPVEEPEPDIAAETEKIIQEEDELELDLDLEEEPEADVTAEVEEKAEEELDELELDLEEEEAEEELGELELDLDLEEEPEAEATAEVEEKAEEELDELELDLDLEEEPEVADSGVEAEEELDLSEIEDMLDTEEEEKADKETEVAESGVEAEEELDLSEIEDMLDTAKEDAIEETEEEPEDIDLEFDIDEESVELLETEDDDLEFELEDIEDVDLPQRKAVSEQVTDGEDLDLEETKVAKKPIKKKRISAPLLVLLIVAILVVGTLGGIVALNRTNTDIPFATDYIRVATDFVRGIPYVGNLLKPEVQDAGNLKISFVQNTIGNKFVENSKTGELFVVTGKVKNDYSDPRSFIKITCNLYTKGKKLTKKETVFCGNILSDLDLSTMDVAAIKKRLNNRVGDNQSNVRVKPGEMIPFMVVFSNLPVDLEEYDFVVEGSSPG